MGRAGVSCAGRGLGLVSVCCLLVLLLLLLSAAVGWLCAPENQRLPAQPPVRNRLRIPVRPLRAPFCRPVPHGEFGRSHRTPTEIRAKPGQILPASQFSSSMTNQSPQLLPGLATTIRV